MSDKPWKQFERDMAKLIGGTRFWANSGESIDVEGPVFLGQCKHVKSMSLNAIAQLAEDVAQEGKNNEKLVREYAQLSPIRAARNNLIPTPLVPRPDPKLGIVCLRTRPGRGKKSKTIVVMDESVFRALFPTGGKDGRT